MVLENKIEALARSMIHRGTVQLSVAWRRPATENLPQVDTVVLQSYIDQLQQVRKNSGDETINIDLAGLHATSGRDHCPAIFRRPTATNYGTLSAALIVEAIENLNQMRRSRR